ncbi:MAG: hypothetical protein ACQESC_01750 [Nanobdellota archaeon]
MTCTGRDRHFIRSFGDVNELSNNILLCRVIRIIPLSKRGFHQQRIIDEEVSPSCFCTVANPIKILDITSNYTNITMMLEGGLS